MGSATSAAVTVGKAAGDFGEPDALEATYAPTLTLANVTPPASYAWVAPTTALSAGSGQPFAATYTDPSGYYTTANGDITVNVAKAQGAGSVTLAGWVYGATASTPVPTSATNGTGSVSYAYAGVGETEYDDEAAPSAVGTYTITATFAETDNYSEAESAAYPFAIAKAPAPNAPSTATATYGETLAAATPSLPDGWAWEDGSTPVGNAPSAYHAATYAATANHAEGRALVLVAIDRAAIPAPQANTGWVEDGTAKVGVEAGDGYTVSGENTGVAAGPYTAIITPDGNHQWDEGEDVTLARNVAWSIAPAAGDDPQPAVLLDFITYVWAKPGGELMMNLNRLEANGYHVAIYRWYKNGEQVGNPTETAVDVLTVGATYRFEIVTTEGVTLASTDYVHSATAVGGEGYAPLRVYPNPATGGQLTIASEQWKPGDVAEVYDLLGVLVATQPIAGDLTLVDISRLSAGVYVVKVGSRAAKVVKQ
jgi:hypothetical protein